MAYGLVFPILAVVCGRKYCVKEGFQLARVKFDRDVEGGKEAVGMGNCNINILVGPELKLA